MAKEPSGVHDCPEGGIGCRYESVPFGGFVTLTGGTIEQRRFQRDYGKVAHATPPDPYADTSETSIRSIVLSP